MIFPNANFDQGLRNVESKYYTVEEFNSSFNSSNNSDQMYNDSNSMHFQANPDFSLFHVNTRSLNKNFESVQELFLQLKIFTFSIIGLSETWLHNNSPPLFNIPNYHMLRSDRDHGRGGGVALYIHNHLKIKVRSDLHTEGAEDLFIEILNDKTKNIIVCIMYRPPNHNIDIFLDNFDRCLDVVSRENKEVYIMGDFNINLLNSDDNHIVKFSTTLQSYAFTSHIDKPTRISCTSQTLIDNIFSNVAR